MEAQRATDNIQQKASDCLGTVNEKPYTLAQRMIDQNEMFKNIRSKLLDVLAERLARKYTKFESGGIVKKPEGDHSPKTLDRDNHNPFACKNDQEFIFLPDGRCIVIENNDNPKKD